MSRAVRLASLLYMGSALLSRVIGLVRESAIGRVLGESAEADVYWVAFILPDFLNYLLAGGALVLVMIPLLQRAERQGGDEALWICFWRVATPVMCLTTVATGALWLCVDMIVPSLAPGFTPDQHVLLSRLTHIILPAQIFHLCGALFSSVLQTKDRHLAPAVAPIVYTICIVAGGLLLGPSIGAEGFAWGVLLGSLLGPFMCPLIGCWRAGFVLKPRWEIRHEDVRTYLLRMLPVMLGFSVVMLDELVVKRLGTSLQDGTVAQLHYARTLMRVPMGVFGLALGVAAFPTLSRLWTQGKPKEAYTLLYQAAEALLLLAGLSQALLMCASSEIAAAIWGRVRMSDEGLVAVGFYCSGLCLGLWAWSLQGLVARGFYAQGRTWAPTLIGSCVMLCALPLYTLSLDWGGIGLTFASSTAISLYVVILWIMVSRSLGGAPLDLLMSTLKVGLSVLISISVVQAISWSLGWEGSALLKISLAHLGVLEGQPEMLTNSTTSLAHAHVYLGGKYGSWSTGDLILWGGLKGIISVCVCLGTAWVLRVESLTLLVDRISIKLKRVKC